MLRTGDMNSIIAFALLAWTTITWFSGPYGRPFLGIPLFSLPPLIPFLLTLLWSAITSIYWLKKNSENVRTFLVKLHQEHKKSIIFLGIVIMVHLLVIAGPAILNYQGENDSDSALHGVAGYHIADGTERPMYVYGVHYVGSLKTHIAALFHLISGKSPVYQRLIGALFYCIFLLILFLFVQRLFNKKTAGISITLAAILPYAVAAQMRYEEFVEIPLWGVISLYLLLLLTHEKKENLKYYFWYGIVLGLLFFAHPQAVYFIITGLIALFAADKLFFIRPRNWLIPLGFTIGTIPTWVDSYFHDWVIFKYFFGTEIHHAPHLLQRFAEGMSRFFDNFAGFWGWGGAYPYTFDFYPSSLLLALLLVGAGICFLYYIYQSRQEIIALITLKNRPIKQLLPLILALVIFLIFTTSAKSSQVGPFRYIFPLWLIIPIIIAATATLPQTKTGRAAGYTFVAISLLLFSLSQVTYMKTTHEIGKKWQEWLTFCHEKGITHFYGDFWLVYHTNFISREKIIGSSCFPLNYDPYPKYREKVDQAPQPPAYVFSPQYWDAAPKRARWFKRSLKYLGIRFQEETIDGHIVYYNLSEHLTPAQLVSMQLLNKVAYRNSTVQKVVGFNGPEELRWITIQAKNEGETIFYADGTRSIAELFVTTADGKLLRRQPLEKNVLPGEVFECQTLLDLDELGGKPAYIHLKLNDIIISKKKQPLIIKYADLAQAATGKEKGTIELTEINRRALHRQLPGFMFITGWGKRITGSNGPLQWSGAPESTILFLVKTTSAGMTIVLEVEPLVDVDFKEKEQELTFRCNNQVLPGSFKLNQAGKIQLMVNQEMLRCGLNRLTVVPRFVEPGIRRIRKVAAFALRPRAFALRSFVGYPAHTMGSAVNLIEKIYLYL